MPDFTDPQEQSEPPRARDLFLGPELHAVRMPNGFLIAGVGPERTETADHFAENMLRHFGPRAVRAAFLLQQGAISYNDSREIDSSLLHERFRDTDYHTAQVLALAGLYNSKLRNSGLTENDVRSTTQLLSSPDPVHRLCGALAICGVPHDDFVAVVGGWSARHNSADQIEGFFASLAIRVLASMHSLNPPTLDPRAAVAIKSLSEMPVLEGFKIWLDQVLRSEGIAIGSASDLVFDAIETKRIDLGAAYVIDQPLAEVHLPAVAADSAALLVEHFGITALPAAAALCDLWPSKHKGSSADLMMVWERSRLPESRILSAIRYSDQITAAECRAFLNTSDIVECFIALAIMERRADLVESVARSVASDRASTLLSRSFAHCALAPALKSGSATDWILTSADDLERDSQSQLLAAYYSGSFGGGAVAQFVNWDRTKRLPWEDFAWILKRNRSE